MISALSALARACASPLCAARCAVCVRPQHTRLSVSSLTALAHGTADLSFLAHSAGAAIYALLFARPPSGSAHVPATTLLITGGDDGVRGWDWAGLLSAKPPLTNNIEPVWTISLPQRRGPRGSLSECPATNSLCV